MKNKKVSPAIKQQSKAEESVEESKDRSFLVSKKRELVICSHKEFLLKKRFFSI